MKSKEFFRELEEYAAELRRTIEAEVEGFSTAPISTHSRPKAAGFAPDRDGGSVAISTHSRPKAAGSKLFSKFTRRA